ncbi:MAG: hypothetical protein ABR583_09710 [Gaiellaceae bacterium]
MLVIYVKFDNIPRPGLDAPWARGQFFGQFFGLPVPSVAEFFADESRGSLNLTPAFEPNTTAAGAVNDGIVVVKMESHGQIFQYKDQRDQLRAVVNAADSSLDFSVFDRNNDGKIRNDELVAHFLFTGAVPLRCGLARQVASGRKLDGKELTGLQMSIVGTDTAAGTIANLTTIMHETGHLIFNMPDLYDYGVGGLDLAGPTCGAAESFRRTSVWQKMHIGWRYPTVVVEDGYYNIGRFKTEFQPAGDVVAQDESFLLYDPDRYRPAQGQAEYAMVENRSQSGYDSGASDTGLVIWGLNDSLFNIDARLGRPITLLRPIGGVPPASYPGSNRDAWDPSDPGTAEIRVASILPGNISVRAIPPAAPIMRVYFDVRGPGVLVDPTTPSGQPLRVAVTPEEASVVAFGVENTGEEADTFTFTLDAGGWPVEPVTKELDPHVSAFADVTLTPPADAPVGVRTYTARGASTSDSTVASTAPIELNVVLDRTAVAYTGAASAQQGQEASFQAALTNPDDNSAPGISGESVQFRLFGLAGAQTATATTDASGVASASPVITVRPGRYLLKVSVPRLGKHAPASVSVPFRVDP